MTFHYKYQSPSSSNGVWAASRSDIQIEHSGKAKRQAFVLVVAICVATACSPTSSNATGMTATQKEEMRQTVSNMKAVLPYRVDAMTTIVNTNFEGNTWFIDTEVSIRAQDLTDQQKQFLKTYVRDQYCRPPYEYLDAGLIISNRYSDELGNHLATVTVSRTECGR